MFKVGDEVVLKRPAFSRYNEIGIVEKLLGNDENQKYIIRYESQPYIFRESVLDKLNPIKQEIF
jgi:hypothetical protein